jgi:hypothetical protein
MFDCLLCQELIHFVIKKVCYFSPPPQAFVKCHKQNLYESFIRNTFVLEYAISIFWVLWN